MKPGFPFITQKDSDRNHGDQSKTNRRDLLLKITALLFLVTPVAQAVPADEPPDFVPLGVYLSWELPGQCAAYTGIERWEDVGRRLDVCADNHVNLLWVTNMSEADLPRLIQECENRSLTLLVSLDTIEGKIKDRWPDEGIYFKQAVPRVVKLAGNSKALAGWVLSDEPGEEDLPHMETLRQMFREADPNRFSLVVSMWPQTPLVPKKTHLPVVCVDLYPFFGPNDVNGPHTAAASQGFFRQNARNMIEAIGEKNIAPWIMGQCFVEIWGPYRYEKNSHLIALPGAYLHWRCPTPAEMRWQVWETFRGQSKGVIFFQLAPIFKCAPETSENPAPDVPWKDILVKEAADAGPAALTTLDAKATPQLEEIGKAFQALGPFSQLILRWRATSETLAKADSPATLQCFVDPKTGQNYAVVVNDNLESSEQIRLHVGPGIIKVVDMVHNQNEIKLQEAAAGSDPTGTLDLKAGDGTILQLIRQE